MIVSASRRTDIPAFFAGWFMAKTREGAVQVSNPFNPRQIKTVSLRPEDVDGIVFWSKNPAPLLPYLGELDSAYSFYFQFTITIYGREFEPSLPDKQEVIATFKRLSEKLGRERVIWRCDPFIFRHGESPEAMQEKWHKLAEELAPYTEKCIFSFVDFYAKCRQPLTAVGAFDPPASTKIEFARKIAAGCRELNITPHACAEALPLAELGITPAACIDRELLSRISGRPVSAPRAAHQRKECHCAASVDIGAYGSCSHNCLYCYAKRSIKLDISN